MLKFLESYTYEVFEEYDEYKEIFMSYDTVRRDTLGREPSSRPGVETEQRPPFPRNPLTTRTSPVTLSTKPLSKQSAEPTVPLVTTLSANTQPSNLTVNVSENYFSLPTFII